MKLICPSCKARTNIGMASRYEIYTCNCGRQFRGIHADHDPFDFVFKKFLLPFVSGYDSARQTPCPFCWSSIGLGFLWSEGVDAPSWCWACDKELPVSFVDKNINDSEPVPEPTVKQQEPPVVIELQEIHNKLVDIVDEMMGDLSPSERLKFIEKETDPSSTIRRASKTVRFSAQEWDEFVKRDWV